MNQYNLQRAVDVSQELAKLREHRNAITKYGFYNMPTIYPKFLLSQATRLGSSIEDLYNTSLNGEIERLGVEFDSL